VLGKLFINKIFILKIFLTDYKTVRNTDTVDPKIKSVL